MDSIGKRIKNARKAAGMTQVQLGSKCGMADSAIRRYESGRGNPTMDTLKRIANALGVPVGELIGAAPALIPDEFNAFESIIERAGFYLRYVEDEGRYDLHKGNESVPLSLEEMKALVRTSERHVITAVEDFMDNKKK